MEIRGDRSDTECLRCNPIREMKYFIQPKTPPNIMLALSQNIYFGTRIRFNFVELKINWKEN